MNLYSFCSMIAVISLLSCCQTEKNNQSLRKTMDDYEAKFNLHDAKAVGQFWDEDAIYNNPKTHEILKGRENITRHFEKFFKEFPQVQMNIITDTLTFPNTSLAEQTSTVTLTKLNNLTIKARYHTVFEKKKNQWLIQKMTELESRVESTKTDNLQELDWLLGQVL